MDNLQLKKERRNLLKKVAALQAENESQKKLIASFVSRKLIGKPVVVNVNPPRFTEEQKKWASAIISTAYNQPIVDSDGFILIE